MKKILALFFVLLFFAIPVVAKDYSRVDNHAKDTPFKYSQTIPELVEYLIKPFKNDEEKKARVIYAWIAYHIDYDLYYVRALDQMTKKVPSRVRRGLPAQTDIFESWLGICGDIAELYQKMAQAAGLEAVVVNGFADTPKVTRKTFKGAGHAWNAVKIDGKWQLLDATWAISGIGQVYGDIKRDSTYNRQVAKRMKPFWKKRKSMAGRDVKDEWFFVKPRQMVKTHYPNDPQWQLLTHPKKVPGAPKFLF